MLLNFLPNLSSLSCNERRQESTNAIEEEQLGGSIGAGQSNSVVSKTNQPTTKLDWTLEIMQTFKTDDSVQEQSVVEIKVDIQIKGGRRDLIGLMAVSAIELFAIPFYWARYTDLYQDGETKSPGVRVSWDAETYQNNTINIGFVRRKIIQRAEPNDGIPQNVYAKWDLPFDSTTPAQFFRLLGNAKSETDPRFLLAGILYKMDMSPSSSTSTENSVTQTFNLTPIKKVVGGKTS